MGTMRDRQEGMRDRQESHRRTRLGQGALALIRTTGEAIERQEELERRRNKSPVTEDEVNRDELSGLTNGPKNTAEIELNPDEVVALRSARRERIEALTVRLIEPEDVRERQGRGTYIGSRLKSKPIETGIGSRLDQAEIDRRKI